MYRRNMFVKIIKKVVLFLKISTFLLLTKIFYFATKFLELVANLRLNFFFSFKPCFIPDNKFFIDQACSVQMAGYCPHAFLRIYGP